MIFVKYIENLLENIDNYKINNGIKIIILIIIVLLFYLRIDSFFFKISNNKLYNKK